MMTFLKLTPYDDDYFQVTEEHYSWDPPDNPANPIANPLLGYKPSKRDYYVQNQGIISLFREFRQYNLPSFVPGRAPKP